MGLTESSLGGGGNSPNAIWPQSDVKPVKPVKSDFFPTNLSRSMEQNNPYKVGIQLS
jgi:hypothetical protein